MSKLGTPTPEVRVVSTPRNPKRLQRWRWSVTWYWPTDRTYPGVYDHRQHIRTDAGYTLTRWGAWQRVRRSYEQSAEARRRMQEAVSA